MLELTQPYLIAVVLEAAAVVVAVTQQAAAVVAATARFPAVVVAAAVAEQTALLGVLGAMAATG